MNETIQTLLKRRSIRAYDATQIPDEDLELILQTGTYAPSGANTQPWHFSVVQNAELLEKLNSIIKENVYQF